MTMKTVNLNRDHLYMRLVMFCVLLLNATWAFSQQKYDTTSYLPQISFSATHGFGPYVLGTKLENIFFAYDLPAETSKVSFRFMDVDSVQVGSSYSEEGTPFLTSASWYVQLDTCNLPLSPQLNVTVYYLADSIANYYVAYSVYPDTVTFKANEGWGPFITNNYMLTDTSWHPVPELYNTFSVHDLPPRTDTIEFRIITADSTVMDSLFVYAPQGQYLESAVFPNIRIDALPLYTRYLRTTIRCNGAPKDGLAHNKTLTMIPQKPKLISKSEGVTLNDSIPTFVQNQIGRQALMVDSLKHARIQNGPGEYFSPHPPSIINPYKGPYSLDIMQKSYTIEAWIKFDLEKMKQYSPGHIMHVDSVWGLYIQYDINDVINIWLGSLAEGFFNTLFITSDIDVEDFMHSEWHHIAFTSSWDDSRVYPEGDFYLDGKQLNTDFQEDDYNYIMQHIDYKANWKTRPLVLGSYGIPGSGTYSDFLDYFITAMDEVRIWNRALSDEEIKNNFQKTILQDSTLLGYWNFNDLRNRLNIISDLSYNNNPGHLKNGAAFIPQYQFLQQLMDTITIVSSNLLTDSIKYSFRDQNNNVIDSVILYTQNSTTTLSYDVSALPYTVNHLHITEYYPGGTEEGFSTDYAINELAPPPIATPRYNWSKYYQSDGGNDKLYNYIMVSGMPKNTEKVILGLEKDNTYYDLETYTKNSVPYNYSLALNGTDNYIETSQNMESPTTFEISLWFKTTTKKGGKLIGFTDAHSGITNYLHDREIMMQPDGALRFNFTHNNGGSTITLTAANRYNDGEWHSVEVIFGVEGATLSVDGSIVDETNETPIDDYWGWWIIGRNNEAGSSGPGSVAEYFEGELCHIYIWESSGTSLLYKLDEGTGTDVHDSDGDNPAELKGSSQKWNTFKALSHVTWKKNLIDKQPGTYTFFARVFYAGGPEAGAYYPLGNFWIDDPYPEYEFSYSLYPGIGYFNEGTQLYNKLTFGTNFSQNGQPDWKENFVQGLFYSPSHELIGKYVYTYTETSVDGHLIIDMGDAPPGSYLSIQFGFNTTGNESVVIHTFSIPININPMMKPKVSGNFGPFDQAIAPGVMIQENTFIIEHEIQSDLNKVVGKFYDNTGKEITSVNGIKINDTIWHITQDMSILQPPESYLKIEYYLGKEEFLALIEGPFKITIHKTRPEWFDFLADDDFHNVQQVGDSVAFSISTTFADNFIINNSSDFNIPGWVPLLGGSNSKMETPSVDAYLAYKVPDHKLMLGGQHPQFFQKIFTIGGGTSSTLSFGFHYSQNNSYSIDSANNLFASQNFHKGGQLTSGFQKLDNYINKIKKLINLAEQTNPESLIIRPTINLNFVLAFQYSSRLHLEMDPVTGKWGSVGDLDIDADSAHTNAYKNSASYHFYAGAAGANFLVGATFLDGLVEGDFVTSLRFDFGWGHSYISIPRYKKKALKSFGFEVYGKFQYQLLWGWYQRTIWGPKMFYSSKIWGDDMTNCFPPVSKNYQPEKAIAANSSWPELMNEIKPVSWYSKMALPIPYSTVSFSEHFKLFTWIDKGDKFGERHLRTRLLDHETRKFSDRITVETNNHAINNAVSDGIDEKTVIHAWAQTRHTNETILEVKYPDVIKEFAQTQDIWYAVYDIEGDSLIQIEMAGDDMGFITDGRAEAHPVVTAISDTRALITWHVADLETHKSELWYALLEKTGDLWEVSSPAAFTDIDGIQTHLTIASPQEDMAVVVWMNTIPEDTLHNKIMTSIFDGSSWSEPAVLLGGDNQYYNYFDIGFNNGLGALVLTTFIEMDDVGSSNHEILSLLPWNPVNNRWSSETPLGLMADTVNHIQLPRITVGDDGSTAIAVKIEKFTNKSQYERISQVDVITGNLNDPSGSWTTISANEYICDTTKQVSELSISYIGKDTLMVLSQEYVMLPTNAVFEPVNGIFFGDSYMNLVLRCFSVDDEGTVTDIDENNYFLGIQEPIEYHSDIILYQNYPNPCRDFTTIKFDVSDNSHIKLEIYDMNGIHTATLIDQSLMYGQYEVRLNTAVLQPGTYIIKLTSNDSMKTLRMIVSK